MPVRDRPTRTSRSNDMQQSPVPPAITPTSLADPTDINSTSSTNLDSGPNRPPKKRLTVASPASGSVSITSPGPKRMKIEHEQQRLHHLSSGSLATNHQTYANDTHPQEHYTQLHDQTHSIHSPYPEHTDLQSSHQHQHQQSTHSHTQQTKQQQQPLISSHATQYPLNTSSIPDTLPPTPSYPILPHNNGHIPTQAPAMSTVNVAPRTMGASQRQSPSGGRNSISSNKADLPPDPRNRSDGKGRDPYSIETICRALQIPMSIWDHKMRGELHRIINKHGLANLKVIPSNQAARDAAIDEWIEVCPEWKNETNEHYRRIYAMDRLKCGMADIRRNKNNKNRKRKGEEHDEAKTEPKTSPSPTRSMPLSPMASSDHGHINTLSGSNNIPSLQQGAVGLRVSGNSNTPSSQSFVGGFQPHMGNPVQHQLGEFIPAEMVQLTVHEPYHNRRSTLASQDFMPKSEYSIASVYNILVDELGFNPQAQHLSYTGPYGKVLITNDRSLRAGLQWEASRGYRYPEWKIESL